MIEGRIRHLQDQQAVEAGPAAYCKEAKSECEQKIAAKQSVLEEKEDAVTAEGEDVDRCIYSSRVATGVCYGLKQAKEQLDMAESEMEALIQHCAHQPPSYNERKQNR